MESGFNIVCYSGTHRRQICENGGVCFQNGTTKGGTTSASLNGNHLGLAKFQTSVDKLSRQAK